MDQTQLLIVSVISGLVSFLVVKKLFGRDTTKFTEYKSTKGKYAALLPAASQESQQKIKTPEGKVTLYITQARGKYHQFNITYCDYPQHVVDTQFPEKMLDGARDGAVANIHGQLLSETLFDFEGSEVEGRELHISVNPKVAMKMRLVLVGRRLYQLQVISAPGNVHSKVVGEFFEGFRVE